MSEAPAYRSRESSTLRVLFAMGVTQSFFDESPARVPQVIDAIKEAFSDLAGRFGISVLGTMDDDELMVGTSVAYPWTVYILADAPDLDAVTGICNLVRVTDVGDAKLWKYLRIEARVGRQLFFGNE